MRIHLIKICLILFFPLSFAYGEDGEDMANRLGEIEDCPKGCECITDSTRGKFDKSGIVRALESEVPSTEPAEESSTKSK